MPGAITVRLFHRLRELVGEKTVQISPNPGSITGLINRFLELHPDAREEMLEENGELSHRFVVSVNERILIRTEWDKTELNDGDEVALLTLISGG